MIFVFGKQLQISLVVFCNIAVIIAYTVNYTKKWSYGGHLLIFYVC